VSHLEQVVFTPGVVLFIIWEPLGQIEQSFDLAGLCFWCNVWGKRSGEQNRGCSLLDKEYKERTGRRNIPANVDCYL
jgi:hypothetical protein